MTATHQAGSTAPRFRDAGAAVTDVRRLSALHLQPQPKPGEWCRPYRACERCTWSHEAAPATVCLHHTVRGSSEWVSIVVA